MDVTSDLGPLGEVTCVWGDAFVVSSPQGDVRPGSDHGFYVRDTRFLNRLELLVDGHPPRPLEGRAVGAARAVFYGHVPTTTDHGVDPTLLVTRHRVVDGSLHEEIVIDNRGCEVRTVLVELTCGTDFAYIFDVKHARELPAHVPQALEGALVFVRDGGGPEVVRLTGSPGCEVEADRLRWKVAVAPHTATRLGLDVEATDVYGTVRPRSRGEAFELPVDSGSPTSPPTRLRCSDVRLSRLVRRSLADLRSLQLPDPLAADDRFHAAGSPWYLTLFGRDALWSAFMALPYDLDVAAGTLRTLARRQGRRLDPDTEEAPGKILHEIRRGSLVHRGDLPPNYYGTIDATPLFIILLHEAWRWGLAEESVAALVPNLTAALAWMRDFGDADGDGFLEYVKQSDRGLDNQGWKDSHDGIQFADGTIARPPIRLVEVQGYAYDAALRGAELLDRFGQDGGDAWRAWAGRLRERFHEHFWVTDADGPYLAVALDGDGRPVDAVASNMGHVLASGLLDGAQSAQVARRLAQPDMASGWGLRTLAATSIGYNPLSYHGGSVWPHDTAIAAWGTAEAGDVAAATTLIRSLVAAAPHFRYRLPELFAGIARERGGFPVPYPAACRPQAWAAAGALLLVRACLRPRPDLPAGRLTLAPLWPPPFRRLELSDLPLAGGTVDLVVDATDGVDHAVRGAAVDVAWDLPIGVSRAP